MEGGEKNAMVRHNLKVNHDFNFKDSRMLVNIHNKKHWELIESNIILNPSTIKQRPCFFK